jgi:hypothetical protein
LLRCWLSKSTTGTSTKWCILLWLLSKHVITPDLVAAPVDIIVQVIDPVKDAFRTVMNFFKNYSV